MRVTVKIVVIIPARMASTRFPGKPLAKICGHSMIEHVYKRVNFSKYIDDAYVATCDKEIADEVAKFGGKAIMTSSEHTRGTERVAEAVCNIEADIVINVQGDEPMVDPVILDNAIQFLKSKADIRCLNLVSPITSWKTYRNQNIVKVAVGKDSKILYFSRSPIPNQSENEFKGAIKQLGIYLIQKPLLMKYAKWEESALEIVEKVDMLRFLENNADIHSFMATDITGVDTPEDLEMVTKHIQKDELLKKIF